MRILHATPHLFRGGAERQMACLLPELAHMGHDVHVAYQYPGEHEPSLQGVNKHQLRFASNHDPRILAQLLRLVREVKPDVIQTCIPQMDILAGLAARLCGIPHVLRESSSAAAYPGTMRDRLRVASGKKASVVVANSKIGRDYWGSVGTKAKLVIVPNCLDLPALAKVTPVDWKMSVNSEPGLRVVFVGRLFNRAKNLDVLTDALLATMDDMPLSVAICGDGAHRPQMEAKVAAAKRGGSRFTFVGAVPSAHGYIKAAEAFVAISHYEGRPNAVMEAMGIGCPMVLSDIPAHRELATPSMAVFVDKDDIEAVKQGILQIAQDRDAARERARLARERSSEWTVETMSKQYVDLYEFAIGNGHHAIHS